MLYKTKGIFFRLLMFPFKLTLYLKSFSLDIAIYLVFYKKVRYFLPRPHEIQPKIDLIYGGG